MRHYSALALAMSLCASPVPALGQSAIGTVAPPVAAPPTTIVPPVEGSQRSTASSSDTSFRSLFTRLPGDFRQTATTDNAIVMLSASAAATLVHPYDQRISQAMTTSPGAETFFAPGKIVGGFAVQFGGAWAAYGVGRAIKHQGAARLGADLVRAQLVNAAYTQGIKLGVGRTRPDGDAWSFPSGHSSGTFANAAVLHRHFGWKAGAPAYAVAAYVAASRIQEKRHFASDVIMGAGVGLISGRAVTVGRGRNRFAVTPMGLPGGAGITFTRLGYSDSSSQAP